MNNFKDVKRFLKDNIDDCDTLILACSGGPDSMCLLDLLLKCNKKAKIVVAHVHHNVRKESDEELEFVKSYASSNNLIFESFKIEKYSNKNFESEARKKRYEFFSKLQKKYNAKYLLTAHHGDDLMETILMRLVRGATLKGYTGFDMISKTDSYTILRPLVFVTKKDIIEYNKINKIKYYNDYTNDLDIHTRNRYRKYILPKLKEESSDVHLKFLKYNQLLNQYNTFVDAFANDVLNKIYVNDVLDIDKFKKEDDLIKTIIIKNILSKIYNDDIIYINDKNVSNIMDLIYNQSPNKVIDLPKGKVAVKSYNNFYITYKKTLESYRYVFKNKVILPNGKTISKVKEEDSNSNYICRLNSKEIKMPIIVRNKKDGDSLEVMHLKGRKKIKDIFIDSKISLEDRKNWPIVTDSDDNILWLPGIKKSKYNKQIDEKYDIILKYY